MDNQEMLATLWFLVLASLMGYASFKVEWATNMLKKVYGLVGINLDFDERGKKVVRLVTRGLAVLFGVGVVAILLFE